MTERLTSDSTHPPDKQQTVLAIDSQYMAGTKQAQEAIYEFLIQNVKKSSPETVLQEFKRLFIEHDDALVSDAVASVYEIVIAGDEATFQATIKRCCYIVVNNWTISRRQEYIPQLVESLSSSTNKQYFLSPTINRLKSWVNNFVNSSDYQELKLFAAKNSVKSSLSARYSSHLLVAQAANLKNPIEQREAARSQAQQLKFRYKFDLVMYIAGLQNNTTNKQFSNPTGIKDQVLRLLKTIVAKRDPSSYAIIAKIFLEENQNVKCKDFKKNLQRHLINSVENREVANILKQKLLVGVESLETKYDEKALTDRLLLKICSQLINYLTTENQSKPSQSFILLISQGHYLTLVILLVKIVLLCRDTRTHLEIRIADLIKYYENHPQESKVMINFLEIYNLMFAIYADNVQIKLD
jgi:hypothetical protein